MKKYLKLTSVAALLFTLISTPLRNAWAEEKFEPPGTKENAEVDKANTVLDGVYRKLISKAEDSQEQTCLKEAQRAWIKWRDAEAMYIARHGGSVGGSALRVDYAEAQLKLIKERIALLKEYAAKAPAN